MEEQNLQVVFEAFFNVVESEMLPSLYSAIDKAFEQPLKDEVRPYKYGYRDGYKDGTQLLLKGIREMIPKVIEVIQSTENNKA